MPKTSDSTTKQDLKLLKRELGLLRSELKEDIKLAIELTHSRAMKIFESYRDDTLTKFDAVMKELEEMREENTLGVGQTRELYEKVENHEKRIKKLETS